MEEAIEILKKIGVREINKTTKISIGKIEDILEKRFSNLQRVRVVGFLKILEREYKVDLSNWLKEYDESCFTDIEVNEEVQDSEHSVNNLDFDTQKQKDDLIEDRKKQLISKKRFYISLIVAVVILGGYFAYKAIFIKTPSVPQTQPITTQEEVVPSPVIEPKEPEPKEIEQAKPEVDSSQEVAPEENADTTPLNSQANDLAPQKHQEESKGPIVVIPNRSLWIEVLDLDDNQKIQTIINTAYPIETKNHRLLISFGHGEFSLQTDDGVVRYDKAYPMRFLYTPAEGLKRIKYAEYLKLSGQDQ